MKRFALAAAVLAMMGLNIGCGGGDTSAPAEPAPEVEAPVETGEDSGGEEATE